MVDPTKYPEASEQDSMEVLQEEDEDEERPIEPITTGKLHMSDLLSHIHSAPTWSFGISHIVLTNWRLLTTRRLLHLCLDCMAIRTLEWLQQQHGPHLSNPVTYIPNSYRENCAIEVHACMTLEDTNISKTLLRSSSLRTCADCYALNITSISSEPHSSENCQSTPEIYFQQLIHCIHQLQGISQ